MSVTLPVRGLRILLIAGVAVLVTACTEVGPNYVRPTAKVPGAYKEANASEVQPPPATWATRHWWRVYHDPQLNALVAQVAPRNQSLKAAAARVREADALLGAAQAARVPHVAIGSFNVGRRNRKDYGVGVSWELDLWGRIRRDIEAHHAQAQASVDDLAAATLSLQAQTVRSYFALREQDAVIGPLEHAVRVDTRWVRIIGNQYAENVAARADVTKAESRLATSRGELAGARVARAQIEHAIAVLLGRPPADFSIAPATSHSVVPQIPAGLPSTLLLRRPDIAAAERQVAAASARIGVRKAQRYPSITLAAGIGILHGLFATADVKAPLYAGGGLRANVSHARAAYDEAVAKYRNTVLDAFREVEDNLVAENDLARSAKVQASAVHSARRSAQIADNQYQAGVTGYRSVVQAQALALDNQRAQAQLHVKRLDASVSLIAALGGGWRAGMHQQQKSVPCRQGQAAPNATSPPPPRPDPSTRGESKCAKATMKNPSPRGLTFTQNRTGWTRGDVSHRSSERTLK
jgi:NodT family efflux transporter outer membrane factor (OMF) lipoprotein